MENNLMEDIFLECFLWKQMKIMRASPVWDGGRETTVEDFSVLRQNAAHYSSMDILETIAYFRLCLC